MGLLAWSPEPGDEGLLLFPGEQDDVTEDKERQKQGQNNVAGSGDLCDTALPTHNFLLESPQGALPSPYPRLSAHLLLCEHQGPPISPSLVGPLFQVLSAAQALRAVRLVLSVQDLPNAWRTDAKICGTRPGQEGRRR